MNSILPFHEYISRTAPLDETEFDALHNLMRKFPYSQTLVLLDLKFSLLAGTVKKKAIKTASLYASDRQKVLELVNNINTLIRQEQSTTSKGHPSRWNNIRIKDGENNPANEAKVVSESEITETLEESNRFHMDTISETLANVYVDQGKFENAIKIYEQLILKNPEKRVYFAGQIEKLKQDHLNLKN